MASKTIDPKAFETIYYALEEYQDNLRGYMKTIQEAMDLCSEVMEFDDISSKYDQDLKMLLFMYQKLDSKIGDAYKAIKNELTRIENM